MRALDLRQDGPRARQAEGAAMDFRDALEEWLVGGAEDLDDAAGTPRRLPVGQQEAQE
jgi:hypothetical protein